MDADRQASQAESDELEVEAGGIVKLIGGLANPLADLRYARTVLRMLGPDRRERARELAETLSRRSDLCESRGAVDVWGARLLRASGLVGSRRRIGPPGRCPTCGAIR